MSGSSAPTLAGFTSFVYGVMQIDPLYLPTDSPVIPMAYNVAMAIVNTALACVPGGIYALAVYNLGGSNLINFAQDQDGRFYFRELRATFGIEKFTPGVVAGSSDQNSATTLLNQEFMKNLTLANLQQLKDPFGRQYLMFAQSYGPTVWGLS